MGVLEGRVVLLGVIEGLGSGTRVSVGRGGLVRVPVGRSVGLLVRVAETVARAGVFAGVGNGRGPWVNRLYHANRNAARLRRKSPMSFTPCAAP